MLTPEIKQEILNLREKKLTPKQIARKMGVKVSSVSQFLKEQATQITIEKEKKGELAPVFKVLVNEECAQDLLDNSEEFEVGERGLGIVLVSRQIPHRFQRYEVATYLVDYWCLGVKDAIPPRKLNQEKLDNFIEHCYENFVDYREISLEQAQGIVYGAVNYADSLGLSPHKDFEKGRKFLGEWSGKPELTFGREGKPYYFSGPYDNSQKIIKTLEEKVGRDNFDFTIVNEGSGLSGISQWLLE